MKKEGETIYEFGIPKVKIEYYNTNNAWGFGGGIGLKYIFNKKLSCKIGTAYYRHLDSSKYITIEKDNKRIFDETDTKVNREKAKEIIKNEHKT